MKKRLMSLVLCLVMVFSLFPLAALAVDSNTNPDGDSEYIAAWHTSPVFLNKDSDSSQAVSALSALRERTFRTRVQLTMVGDGSQVQLTYSNKYGTADLEIGEITLAKGVASDINKITGRIASIKASELSPSAAWEGNVVRTNTSYYGHTVWVIPAGQIAKTKPINISALGLSAMDYLSVSTWVTNMHHFGDGFTAGLTGGRTAYLGLTNTSGSYNHTEAADLDNVGFVSPVELTRSDDTGDYNVIPFLTEIDVKRANSNQYATVLFGDSTLANDIPTLLGSRLNANNVEGVAFVSSAIKGNELLLDGQNASDDSNGSLLGDAGVTRIHPDALDLPGVKKVIVKLGINDILHPYCSNLAQNYTQLPTAQAIINGYQNLIDAAHAQGVEIYFYELSPWKGYTRNDTLAYSDSIDAIRRDVNSWLAANGKDYDDFSSFGYIPLDSMNDSGDANKLKAAFTTDGIHYTKGGQNQVAKLTPISIFWKTEQNEDNLGEEVTVRNIYFATQALTNGHEYFICTTNAANVKNSASANQSLTGYVASNPGVETTATNTKTAYRILPFWQGEDNGDPSPLTDLVSNAVTVQRGQEGKPYIIGTDAQTASKWMLTDVNGTGNYFWMNTLNGQSYYLSWYFPGLSWSQFFDTLGVAVDYIFSTGVRVGDPKEDSSLWNIFSGGNAGWYTLNKATAQDDNQVKLWYDASATSDKYLGYYTASGSDANKFCTIVKDNEHLTKNYNTVVTMYDNTAYGVKASLDIIQGSNPAIVLDPSDNTVVYGKGASDSIDLFYKLNSVMLESHDQPTGQELSDTGVSNGNNAAGPFKLYTFGSDQRIFWSNSNSDVLTVTQSNGTAGGGKVTFTGNGGTSTVTLNYFWQEFDGLNYVFDDNAGSYYTEAQKNAAIANGSKPESEDVDGFHWFMVGMNNEWVYTNYHYLTSDTVITNVVDYDVDILLDGATDDGTAADTFSVTDVTPTSTASLEALKITEPADIPYEIGDHWEWTSSDTNIATITQDDSEFATLNYTGNSGTTVITVRYVDADGNTVKDHINGDDLTSSITVNTTEKPVTIDVRINNDSSNPPSDFYINETAGAGIQIPLEAFIDYGTIADGSWSWKVYDETAEESHAVISLDNATARTPIATVNGEGLAYAVVTYSYTDTAGQPQTATSTVAFIIKFVTNTKQVVIDFGAKYELDSDVYSYEPINGAVGFDLSDVPGDLTFTPPFTKNEKTYDFTAFNAAESATYNTKAVKTSDETVFNQVTVVPASNIYYSDGLANKTLTPNDQIGYNSAVTYSEPDTQSGTYTFTFKGQRVDVYCTNKAESGTVAVTLVNGENTQKKLIQMREDENIVRGNAPTVSFGNLNGEVVSTLTIVASSSANFRLEGVRVYNANSANAAVEPGAQYINLRDKILDEPDAVTLTGTTQGILFIDGDTFDYKNNGPKNEVYLAQNQAVAFEVPTGTTGVMVAVRTPSNDSGTVKLNGEEKTVSKMDMYYPVNLQDNSVTIQNNGTNLISVTNVKLVGDFESTTPGDEGARSLSVSPQLKTFAARMMAADSVETPDDPGTPENPQPTQQPTIQQLLQQLLSQFVKNLFSSISRLFGN